MIAELCDDVADKVIRRGISDFDRHQVPGRGSPIIDVDNTVNFRSQSFMATFKQPFGLFRNSFDQHTDG